MSWDALNGTAIKGHQQLLGGDSYESLYWVFLRQPCCVHTPGQVLRNVKSQEAEVPTDVNGLM